jgi:hypothetical protein
MRANQNAKDVRLLASSAITTASILIYSYRLTELSTSKPQRDLSDPLNQTIPSMIGPLLRQPSTAALESFALDRLEEQDLELLSKFQARTALTISTGKSLRIYQNEIIKLAYSVGTLS